jgi:hypothetical protein
VLAFDSRHLTKVSTKPTVTSLMTSGAKPSELSVNPLTSDDEEQAYCEKFLKLADTARRTPQRMRKAS